jgi:hypothetical protein
MSRTALRRAVRLSIILIALSLALGYLRVGGTFALWEGATTNANSALEAGWIPPPTSLAATPSGDAAALTWTAGTSPATGQQLTTADGGTGASASCGTYGSATSVTSPTTSAGTSGHWWCGELVSTSATAWQSIVATFTPIRVGLFPTAVAIANGGTGGSLDGGDTITITFDQSVDAASGTSVCAFGGASGTGAILIGDSTCSSSATDPYTIGELTGLTVGGTVQAVSASVSTSDATITVTVGASGPSITGAGTFTASTSLTSTTGSVAACAASYCTVGPSGGF